MWNRIENHKERKAEAKKQWAIWFLDVCDTFDYDNYPSYFKTEKEKQEKTEHYRKASMQRIDYTIILDDWVKQEHILYTHLKEIKWLHMTMLDNRTMETLAPKSHWIKWSSSIISPSIISNNHYELMHNWNITRYKTLESAQFYAENNPAF